MIPPAATPPRRRLLGLGLLLTLSVSGCATHPYPPTRTYHASSQRLEEEIFYDREGRQHGTCRTWYESGVLRSRSVFEHGKLVRLEMWGQDSQKIRFPKGSP